MRQCKRQVRAIKKWLGVYFLECVRGRIETPQVQYRIVYVVKNLGTVD